jgi:2-polyprenyl-3-methyl-5-hydroxy-6-metoxy-1,4-benzoquinol methylase
MVVVLVVVSPAPSTAVCPACGDPLREWRSVPASEPALAARRFDLWRCPDCGTAVTAGAPEPALHDAGAFRAGRPRLYRLAAPVLRIYDAQRLGLLRRAVAPPARVLDAGAGQGRFVAAAAAAGYAAVGIEPARRGMQRAAEAGAAVTMAGIEEFAAPPASFDAITLWHVLEHLQTPGAALTRLREWLVPGGGLLVGVPNLAGLQARMSGRHWYHLDVPRHRVHFTPAGLARLLAASGFEVLEVHHLLLEHNPFGMWQSAVNLVTAHPSYLYNLLKRNAPLDMRDLALTLLAVPLAPVAAVAELAAGLAGRGGTIAVLARRSEASRTALPTASAGR